MHYFIYSICIALHWTARLPPHHSSLSFLSYLFLSCLRLFLHIIDWCGMVFLCFTPPAFLMMRCGLWGRSLVERKIIELNWCSIFTFLGPNSAKSSLIVLSTKCANSQTNTNSARSDVLRSHIGWAFLVGTQKGHCKVCGLRKQLVVSSTSSSHIIITLISDHVYKLPYIM